MSTTTQLGTIQYTGDDLGDLTIDHWIERDFGGFAAAVAQEFDGDWADVLANLIVDRSRMFKTADVQHLASRMDDRLNKEIERKANWISDYLAGAEVASC